jgi:cupin superfamily acireductone dioxygenase involved in methionine salvage
MATQKENITYIKQEIKKQGVLLERLANAVCGDKDFGQTGLIEQVNEHSDYINNDKNYKNKIMVGITAITTIWGLIITAVVKFWKE